MHLSSCFERVIKSVSAIRNAFNSQSFNFSKVSVDNVLKKYQIRNTREIQSTDVPVKILTMLTFLEVVTFLMHVLTKVRSHLH